MARWKARTRGEPRTHPPIARRARGPPQYSVGWGLLARADEAVEGGAGQAGSTVGKPLGRAVGKPLGSAVGKPLGSAVGKPAGSAVGKPGGSGMPGNDGAADALGSDDGAAAAS